MRENMEAVRGVLVLLKTLSEGSASMEDMQEALEDADIFRNERTVRRWMAAMREEGFDVERGPKGHELVHSPARIPFGEHEALATLSVLESLSKRDPVYGKHLASAAMKLRAAIPQRALRFADSGRIEFPLEFASDPPENPETMDTLLRAIHKCQKAEILYHSLNSASVRKRTVEPVRIAYAQRARRLYAYEKEERRVTEFRINRILDARVLPDKFAPEAHIKTFEPVSVRLTERAFTAYGKTVVPDEDAKIERLDDGSAIVSGTTPSVFWTVRDLAALGPDAEVLESPAVRRELAKFLRETLGKYE
ncbi:MAG: WYL domain-containing protein [Rubrobacter sp.]|nr:WYL domain-containing protein [Rubrobacter sp.]